MQYTLRNLQEATEYSITVSAIPSDDEASKDYLIATTLAAGQCLAIYSMEFPETVIYICLVCVMFFMCDVTHEGLTVS